MSFIPSPRLSTRVLLVALVVPLIVSPAAPAGETREQPDQRMAWWRDARFGMFIHWGLYSITAGQWKDKTDVDPIGCMIQRDLKIPGDEYAKLQHRFNPTKYDPAAWVALARRAGMKYIVITSKHHEGFCLFDSKLTDYDAMGTPFGCDLLKPLADECHRQDMRLCFYYSILDWHHPDAQGDRFPEYVNYMRGQLRELLTNYGPIGVLWFDGEWIPEWTEEQGQELYRYVRGIQPTLIVNDRVGRGRQITRAEKRANVDDTREFAGDFGTPEQEIPGSGITGWDWESCMTMNDCWGYRKNDHNWKSTQDLLRKLVDTVSKGGNLLLNVGPTAEGEIPAASVERLEAIGRWMDVNGESIHGTTAGPLANLAWGRSTQKPGLVYLHVFDWPTDGRLMVPGLKNPVAKAFLLADPACQALAVDREGDNLVVAVSDTPADLIDTVVVLQIDDQPPRLSNDPPAGERR